MRLSLSQEHSGKGMRPLNERVSLFVCLQAKFAESVVLGEVYSKREYRRES